MSRLDWTQLLSDYRCRRPGAPAQASRPEPFRSPFEADCDRIVYSTPFRKLACKTQVHPSAPHLHAHNRLTHSIEVASVGRSFARRLGDLLVRHNEIPDGRTIDDLCFILQAACLAHDIGNPPFGHAGEYAVRQWARDHQTVLFGADESQISPPLQQDWLLFEGNAQGFRMAARADNPQTGYMRLTYASLGAMVKYPWDSSDGRAVEQEKFNVFSSEKELFAEIWEHLGLCKPSGTFARHPLSFLSEAADDICYRVLDLEDAAEMGILPDRAVRSVYNKLLQKSNPHTPLAVLRGKTISALVATLWSVFENNYPQIIHGDRTNDLKADITPDIKEGLKEISSLYKTIFAHRSKVATELGAYQILGRIVGTLSGAVSQFADCQSFEKLDFLSRRSIQLAWGEKFADIHRTQPLDWWTHQVMDYFASLTDDHARQLAGEIAGS